MEYKLMNVKLAIWSFALKESTKETSIVLNASTAWLTSLTHLVELNLMNAAGVQPIWGNPNTVIFLAPESYNAYHTQKEKIVNTEHLN